MGTTRAGFMVNISTGHHNSRASAGVTLYTSATYVRVPTAMEFHPVRYDINLWRINAVPGPPFPPPARCWPLNTITRDLRLGEKEGLIGNVALAFSPFPFQRFFLNIFGPYSEISHSVNLWPGRKKEDWKRNMKDKLGDWVTEITQIPMVLLFLLIERFLESFSIIFFLPVKILLKYF